MKRSGCKKPYSTLIFCIETVLPLLLLCAKLTALNLTLIDMSWYTPAMVAFSLLLITGVCLLVRLALCRSHVPFLMTVYCILSIVLLIDTVYSGYTNKLPSAIMLQYTGQLEDVSDAILANVTFGRLLYAVDVPLWILYFINIHPRLKKKALNEKPTYPSKKKAPREARLLSPHLSANVLSLVTVICAMVCAGFCLFSDFEGSYFKSEIISYHVLDIASLFKEDSTDTDIPINPFPDMIKPVDKETSPYYAIASGKNVITIQVEALQNFVIGRHYNGQELTPNLNRLISENSLYFDRYYYQIGGGNTADAEFAVNNSLYAPETEAAYSKYPYNDYYSMATLLKDHGYKNATAFHGYMANYWSRDIAYPGQGFDTYLSGDDYYKNPSEKAGLGVSDEEFFKKAAAYLAGQEGPFYAFLITLSSHYPYEIDPSYFSLDMKEEDKGTLYGNYLQSIHYTDYAIGVFLDELKTSGLYESSVITIYGDHYGLPVYKNDCRLSVSELIGKNYTYADHLNVPLIIHTPGSEITETISHVGGHVDLMPTLLHLLGIENKKGVMLGYNILTTEDGTVYEQTHLARGSFIQGDVLYQYPFDGIESKIKAYNIKTGENLDVAPFAETAQKGRDAYALGMYILENDLALRAVYDTTVETDANAPTPDTEAPAPEETDPYRSIASGRNVITVQVEALQNFVIGALYNGQELTPNLNRLIAGDTLYFDHYYYQIGGGNTADAEFAVNNSLYAPEAEAAYSKYPNNTYYSMATLLKDHGYKSATAFHGYTASFWNRNVAYPGQGFDAYLSGDDFYANPTEATGMGVTDAEFFRKAVDYLSEKEGPFYAFLITLTSHYPFQIGAQYQTLKLETADIGTLYGNYLQSIHYADYAIGELITALKDAGLYESSVITIYGDHFGLPVYQNDVRASVTKFIGKSYTYVEHFNVPLIIHTPGSALNETVSNVGGHIDVMPTLLHLLGIDNEKGIMLGYNILETEDGAVYQQTHLGRGSFINKDVLYECPIDGIEAKIKVFDAVTGERVDRAPYEEIRKASLYAYELGNYILQNDLALREAYNAAAQNGQGN